METNAYYLKLCGSGGGYVLGLPKVKAAQKALQGFRLEVVLLSQ